MSGYVSGVTAVLIAVGTGFSIIGVIGYIRFPDVFTRLHATGKVGVFGVVMLLLAAAVHTPLSWGLALVLIFFLVVTGPAAAHAIGSAAMRLGIRMRDPVRDDLKAPFPDPVSGHDEGGTPPRQERSA